MYLSKKDIENTDRIKRLNIINSISGIKPGNLIGTISKDGNVNLAIFSSVVHLGSNPGFLGFVLRPQTEVRRHTYENILETGFYTINHIHESFIEKAHYTSTKFPADVSEFEQCGLTEDYQAEFHAPFVKESPIKIGMKHVESVEIKSNDTLMVVGQIEHLIIPDEIMDERGYIHLEQMKGIGIGGLNSYYALKKLHEFSYARVGETPNFK